MSQADSQSALIRLRETIAQLQGIVSDLESANIELPPSAIESLETDTARLIQALKPTPEVGETSAPESATSPAADWDDEFFGTEPEPPKPATRQEPRQPSTSPRTTVRPGRSQKPWWQQQKLWVGAISAAIAFIFVWKIATRSPEPTTIAEEPQTGTPIETVEPLPETSSPAQPEVIVQPEPTPEIIEPEPPKPLTPEQRLIAAIQAQVDDVTQPYGDNIVRAIEADFDNNILRITVGDAWYLLKEGLQDRLGKDVLELARLLDFQNLRVKDLEGNFVARNPVVGDALVIVRRYQSYPGD